MLADFRAGVGRVLKRRFRCGCTPFEQVGVIVGPVFHHRAREVARHDVVLVLFVERTHDVLELFRQIKSPQFGGVGQPVHHVGNAAVLEAFGHRLPAILDQLGRVAGLDAFFDHLVETKNGAGLQHAAEDGLFTHQVGFHFRDERRFQDAGAVPAGAGGVGFRQLQAFAARVVFGVYRNQGGYAEAALVFLAHLGAGALGCDHDDREVFANLHAFFDDVEPV